MKLVKTRIENGFVYENVVCDVPETIFCSVPAMRFFLAIYAARELGKNTRIVKNSRGCLVPMFVVDSDTGTTLEIV